MPTISFGIEFEFDFIDPRGNTRVYPPDRYTHVEGWDYQRDPTAGSEIRTPVLTDLNEALTQISLQFNHWITRNNGIAPYAFNRDGRSLGQHIHIGLPSRHLRPEEKRNIAKAMARVYPFLASLHAQPIPSRRGLNPRYAMPMWSYNWEMPYRDHYAEISDSYHGTDEFRLFDANIPQVSLTCVWMMIEIARRHLRNHVDFDRERYRNDRNQGLRFGLRGLDLPYYLREVRDLALNPTIPDIPAIREILYIASRYYMNPYDVLRLTNANHYEWFRLMFTYPHRFIDNILEIRNIRNRERLERWKEEASSVENLDQLIGLALASREAIITQMVENPPETSIRTRIGETGITRSFVRRQLELGRVEISRLNGVWCLEPTHVAERVSELLCRHGDGFTNGMSASEVINCRERFYVAWVYNERTRQAEILGCIAIDRQTGEIKHLVVDRRFRRLGIANMLIEHVLNRVELREGASFHAYVRANNEASLAVFRMRGFQPYQKFTNENGKIIVLRRD